MSLFALLNLYLLLSRINAEKQPACGDGSPITRIKAIIYVVDKEYSRSDPADEGDFSESSVYIHDGETLYKLSFHFKNLPRKYEIDISVFPVTVPRELVKIQYQIFKINFDTGISCFNSRHTENFFILMKNGSEVVLIKNENQCRKWISTINNVRDAKKVTWFGSFDRCKGLVYTRETQDTMAQTALQVVNDDIIANDPFPTPFYPMPGGTDSIPDFLIPYKYKDRAGLFDVGLWSNGTWIYLRASPWKYHSWSGGRKQLYKYEQECVNYPTGQPLTTSDSLDETEPDVYRDDEPSAAHIHRCMTFQFILTFIHILNTIH